MRQREEEKHPRLALDEAAEVRVEFYVLGVFDEVAVREHRALGPASGARRVDDGGEVVDGDVLCARVELSIGDVLTKQRELVHRGPIEAEERGNIHEGGEGFASLCRFRRDKVNASVGDDPGELRLRGRRVDRHGHRPRGENREVHDRPFDAGLAHDADAVTALNAGGNQPLGDGADARVELDQGDHRPRVVLILDLGEGAQGVCGDPLGEHRDRVHSLRNDGQTG